MAFNYLSLARDILIYGIPLVFGIVIFLLSYGRRAFAPVMQTVIVMGRLVDYRLDAEPVSLAQRAIDRSRFGNAHLGTADLRRYIGGIGITVTDGECE